MNAPPLFLVVGMHRSGTSLLASMLQSLGIHLPGPLIAADAHNPEGYYECRDITALQEELLIDLERWWPGPDGVRSLPRGWLHTPRAERAAACLQRLLADALRHQRGPWAIKDPRTSLLLPLWRRAAEPLHLPLRLLLAVRDPAEVVVSLLQRDGAPAGMTASRAQALWLRHQQQLLADRLDLPLLVVSYNRWFLDPAAQIEQLARFCLSHGGGCPLPSAEPPQQALGRIRPAHRHSQAAAPAVRLKPSLRRWYRQLERAAASGDTAALSRWAARQHRPGAPRARHHPWRRALTALGHTRALPRGLTWLRWRWLGLPEQQLQLLRQPGLPGEDPSSGDGPLLPPSPALELIGAEPEAWSTHLWIAQLPLPPGAGPAVTTQVPADAALHLQPLARTACEPQLLRRLATIPRVFDPDNEQVRLLRLLGVNAERLASGPQSAGHRLFPAELPAEASRQLGLPDPAGLLALGAALLVLGRSDHDDWLEPPAGLLQIPAFPPQPPLSAQQARLLAGWVIACQQAGLQLVRLDPGPGERLLWQALQVPCFRDPIDPWQVLEELQWRRQGCPQPAMVITPQPAAEICWSRDCSMPAEAAICISSYQYMARLPAALESCRRQTLEALELLIVDDASSDDSVAVCSRWLQQHGRRFCRVRLLRHHRNVGLAAARNTAFTVATAPWCLVLDADNQLDAAAVMACLTIARSSPSETAVVHPLIRILDDAGTPLGLVGEGHPFQRENFQPGNFVDAMALIRRSAWQAVGGYSHIQGGWEDYDFWCKLIGAGFHGVLCPQVLATYRRHGDSMLQSQTSRRIRTLSRLLQHRHPWLQLELAQQEV